MIEKPNHDRPRDPATTPLRPALAAIAHAELPRRAIIFWMALWLGVALAACKACHWTYTAFGAKERQIYAQNITMGSYADLVYVICIALIAHLLLRTAGHWRYARWTIWALIAIWFTFSIMYGVSLAWVFEFLRRPIAYADIYAGAGDLKNMQSSVDRFVNWKFWTVVGGSAVMFWGFVWISSRPIPRRGAVGSPRKRFLWLDPRVGDVPAIILKAAGALIAIFWIALAALGAVRLEPGRALGHLLRPVPWLNGASADLGKLPQTAARTLAVLVAVNWIVLFGAALVLFWAIVGWADRAIRGRNRTTPPATSTPLYAVIAQWALAPILVGAICAFALLGCGELKGVWGQVYKQDRRISENPHYTLVASCIREWTGHGGARLGGPFPPEFLNDFKTVADRGGTAGQPTVNIKRGPKNVIIIIGESLGAQHMQVFGGKYPTTPNLMKEADNCLIFDNYYGHLMNTANAIVTMTLGIHSLWPRQPFRELTVERPGLPGTSIAQLLKEKGHQTAFISVGDNAWSNQAEFLKNRGFDTIWDHRDSGQSLEFSWGLGDKHLIDMLLRWTGERDKSKPFFIMSWTQGNHHPYFSGWDHQRIEFLSDADRKAYGNMWWDLGNYLNATLVLDRELGRLFDGLRKSGLADDTIVIITGDHGDTFGIPHEQFGHTGLVYQENVRVPMILWNPKLFKSAGRSRAVGSHVDLDPTVLDLLDIPAASSWQGRSLFDPARPDRAYFYGTLGENVFGMRDGNYKYLYREDFEAEELYDLSTDPDEQNDLSAKLPDICAQMRQRLSAWLSYQRSVFP